MLTSGQATDGNEITLLETMTYRLRSQSSHPSIATPSIKRRGQACCDAILATDAAATPYTAPFASPHAVSSRLHAPTHAANTHAPTSMHAPSMHASPHAARHRANNVTSAFTSLTVPWTWIRHPTPQEAPPKGGGVFYSGWGDTQ